MKRVLMCRFGGMGDGFALTPVAKELHRQGCRVLLAVMAGQEAIFDNIEYFYKVLPTRRFPHPINGMECIKMRYGWGTIESIKSRYDQVYDFKWSVEGNSMWKGLPYGPWTQSMNSNFVNWVDLSFAWANMDPTTISPEDKVPIYRVKDEERVWAEGLLKGLKVIGVHLQASSLSRTWYYPQTLPGKLMEACLGYSVLVYNNDGSWTIHTQTSTGRLGPMPPRNSFALLEQMRLVICVDSAINHVSEAVGTDHLTIYSTVPAWTRECYYKHSFILQTHLPCQPCFNLDRFCPENAKKATETLSSRERDIERLMNELQGNLGEVAQRMSTTVEGIQKELQAGKMRMEALCDTMPECIRGITSEMIVEKTKEILAC